MLNTQIYPKRFTAKHINKGSRVKRQGEILKTARKKQKQLVIYKGTPMRLPADFSAETL